MQVCDECVCTKQKRENHQGPAITRNAPDIWQQTAELQPTNGLAAQADLLQTSSEPAEKHIIMVDAFCPLLCSR